MMAKKKPAATKAKKPKAAAAAKARPAAAKKAKAAPTRKAKAAPAKKGAATAAKKHHKKKKRAPSLQIVAPADGGTATRTFPVKCKGTGLSSVDVTIARTGLTKSATLSGGFWVAQIAVADIGPSPSGTKDTIGASGTGGVAAVGALPVQVVIK
jgi:hypothetical protein